MKTSYVYAFPRPSVTATIALLVQSTWNYNPTRVILGKRGRKDGTYAGFLCLPGGFLDAKVVWADIVDSDGGGMYMGMENDVMEIEEDPDMIKPGETIEETAIREVFEETGLVITRDQLELAHVHSHPETDPRAHVVNICYYVMLTSAEAAKAVAGDDLEALEQVDIEAVKALPLAFNHNELFEKILAVAESKYPESPDDPAEV